jgi:cardiolipin synthase (CMP-forming)
MDGAAERDVATEPDPRVITVPNLISVVRLLCIPWFLWLVLDQQAYVSAGLVLGVLGATDWVDGWIARHFDQGSELGKVLDPVADRILLIAAGVALLIDGIVPAWVGVLVLAREAVVSAAVLWLAAAGARRIDVQWIGKAGTLALMFALPGFLFIEGLADGTLRDLMIVVTWSFTIGGLILSYWAAAGYVPLARQALREGRAARAAEGTS